MTIWTLNPDQTYLVKDIGHAFVAEAKYPFAFNPVHFDKFWSIAIGTKTGVIWVAEDQGRIVGTLGAVFTEDMFSGVPVSLESFWFVHPSHRGSSAGVRLLAAFEDESDRRGIKGIMMAHIAGLNGDAMERFYTRRGYGLAEQLFRKIKQ